MEEMYISFLNWFRCHCNGELRFTNDTKIEGDCYLVLMSWFKKELHQPKKNFTSLRSLHDTYISLIVVYKIVPNLLPNRI